MLRIGRLTASTLAALLSLPMGLASAYESSFGVREYTGPGTAGIEQAGDIQHIKNIGGWSGSDIEFATREVVKLSNGATGDPVCKTFDSTGACVEFQKELRDFAVAGALNNDARVIDITDPRNPVVVGIVACRLNQNDIQIQGNILLAAQDSASGTCRREGASNLTGVSTAIVDFSDPRKPAPIARISYSRGSHNHTFHPTQPIVYLSNSDLENPTSDIPIYDLSNPAAPALVRNFTHLVSSPHDITFNATGTRAYVASVSSTYILNTEDAKNPSVISTIPNEGISISHQADPTPDGNFLLVSDELGGGAAGLSPGGPVHVYDIRDETRPVKVGLIFDDCVGISQTCSETPTTPEIGAPVATAHVFRINPDGYTMAIAWYKDGVHVIDYSDVRSSGLAGSGAATGVGTRTVGRMKMPNANTWSAKMWQERHPGFVFANDINRGLDVFYVPSMGPGFLASGSLKAGHPASFEAGVGVTRIDFETNCEYTPVTNGVDGFVSKVPAQFADGNFTMTAAATMAAGDEYDLDMLFYNKDCGLIGAADSEGFDQVGDIPAGTAYVLTNSWYGGAIRFNLTVAPKTEE